MSKFKKHAQKQGWKPRKLSKPVPATPLQALQPLWSQVPAPSTETTVAVTPKIARMWSEGRTERDKAIVQEQIARESKEIPAAAWSRIRSFLDGWHRVDEGTFASNSKRRSYLHGYWNEYFPGDAFPSDEVPAALIRARIGYTAYYLGFKEAGALDLLPKSVLQNYQAVHGERANVNEMTPVMRNLIALDVKYSLSMPRQKVDEAGRVIKATPGSGLVKKEKSSARVEMEATLAKIAAGKTKLVFRAGNTTCEFAPGSKTGFVCVDGEEEYDLADAKRADTVYWRMWRWYRKEASATKTGK